MAKIRKPDGMFLKIPLQDGYFTYARFINKTYIAFYDIKTKEGMEDLNKIAALPVLFITAVVWEKAVETNQWETIGKVLPLEAELQKPLICFIQDRINPNQFFIYDNANPVMHPATREECIGLERAAVSQPEHIEDRLLHYYFGTPMQWPDDMLPEKVKMN